MNATASVRSARITALSGTANTIAVRRVPTATLADRVVVTKAVAVSRPNLVMAMGHTASDVQRRSCG